MNSRRAKNNAKRSAGQPAIELRGVTVVRGGRTILGNIDWTVAPGTCAAILGPNGSGKSTLVRVIMGQMWPAQGEVTVLGQKFGETDLNQLRESIRIVQANGPVEFDPEESALRVVLTGFFGTIGLFKPTEPLMQARAEERMRQVGLAHQAHQPFRTLSSGERMRCLIARAMVVPPRLLILDEPTAGLDLLAREQVLSTVRRLISSGQDAPTVLMITHHVEELLPRTKQVLILRDGRVSASGSPQKVITPKILSRAFGVPVNVTHREGRFWLRVKSNDWAAEPE